MRLQWITSESEHVYLSSFVLPDHYTRNLIDKHLSEINFTETKSALKTEQERYKRYFAFCHTIWTSSAKHQTSFNEKMAHHRSLPNWQGCCTSWLTFHCSLTADWLLFDCWSLTAVLSIFDCCMTSKCSHNAAILQLVIWVLDFECSSFNFWLLYDFKVQS